MITDERMTPFAQFFLLLGLCGAGMVIGSLTLVLLAKWMLGVSAFALQDALNNANNVQFFRLAQAIGAFFMLAVPVFFFALIMSRKPFGYIGFSTSVNIKQVGIVILLAFAALLASDFLAIINERIPLSHNLTNYFKQKEDEYSKQVMILATMKSPKDYIVSLIVLAFLPAMFEEIFFRGGLQQIMMEWTRNAFVAILITSILFSAIHLSYYGFLPRMFLGIILGYVFYYSKNLWLNILFHFLNNAVAITQMYYLSSKGTLKASDLTDSGNFSWYIGLFGVIGVILLLQLFKAESDKMYERKQIAEDEFNIH